MFTEQCKRRGIKLEDLDKGWVPQHKIGEETDDEVVDDDDLDEDFEDDDDMNEEELFKTRPAPPRKESVENNEISFKTSKSDKSDMSDSEDSKTNSKPIKVEKPEISMADLEAMFGPASTPVSEPVKEVDTPKEESSSLYGTTPNRDRITLALKKADVSNSNTSVTFDKTSTDPGMAATVNIEKPKIKLNIKQKPQE